MNEQIPVLNRCIQAGAGFAVRDVEYTLREGLMKGVVKNFDCSSLEQKPPECDSEQVEELLDVTG